MAKAKVMQVPWEDFRAQCNYRDEYSLECWVAGYGFSPCRWGRCPARKRFERALKKEAAE